MPTSVTIGNKVKEIDLVGLFQASEGMIAQYYGRIGNGKTYNATADILDDLKNGEVVYCNWHLNYEGYDDRLSPWRTFINFIFFRKRYYKFDKKNLHYIEINEDFIDNFEKLTDCKVYLDEGHVAFDSYEMAKMSLRKRKAVLHTRHFNRSIYIISQRPTAVHVTMRANVNVFYKCEKILSWPFLAFKRSEFQDMVGETVDENAKPISVKRYIANKRVLNSYNSKYLRNGLPASQKVFFEAYDLTLAERWSAMCAAFRGLFRLQSEQTSARSAEKFLPINSTDVGGQRSITSIKKPERAQYGSGSVLEVAYEDRDTTQTLGF